ncbi:four helix bundle protein [Ravibacter arvi]|uniref:four helix bundle protein n=1 Tax=Ravibacter arvi TaxID=2051041 RepID=UPI0031E66E41
MIGSCKRMEIGSRKSEIGNQKSEIRNWKLELDFVYFGTYILIFLLYDNMRDFTEFEFWRLSHLLTLEIYRLTKKFPKEETYGLVSQMRKAAFSIPSNIAEGCGRSSNAELKRFLIISAGSASELQYQVRLSKDLLHIDEHDYQKLTEQIISIRKLIFRYSEKL